MEKRAEEAILSSADAALRRLRDDPSDRSAWAAFYKAFRPHVITALFYAGVRDETDQEELASELFFRFLTKKKIERFNVPEVLRVRRYLQRSAANLATDAANRRRRLVGLDDIAEPVSDASPDSAIYIREVLERLGADDRDFIDAYVEGGYSLRNVAQQFAISYAAAGTRLHRIRRRVREILSGDV